MFPAVCGCFSDLESTASSSAFGQSCAQRYRRLPGQILRQRFNHLFECSNWPSWRIIVTQVIAAVMSCNRRELLTQSWARVTAGDIFQDAASQCYASTRLVFPSFRCLHVTLLAAVHATAQMRIIYLFHKHVCASGVHNCHCSNYPFAQIGILSCADGLS